MTAAPDPTEQPAPEPESEPEQPPTRKPILEPQLPDGVPNPPVDDRFADAITSVIAVTAAPGPAPSEGEGPGAAGPEIEVETADSAADHTVAYPSPIPEYSMEATGGSDDPDDTDPTHGGPGGPTVSHHADTESMGSLTPESPLLAPEPPAYFPPEPPYLAPVTPPPLAPAPPTYLAPEPALPAASVRPRSRPLFGTIVWGVILLSLAGYVLLGVLVPTPADPTLWLLGGVILIGLLLIVVGIIAALRRAP
ncbi:hypothetical protein [Cryobacterium cryoconiti]|uniref:Uncharacterized protein n=1 Tax=Cryobacterium cryoconiti TaxID=1259239 RepID=A0A4Y8JTJ5_9MICO|nr:hypothetical protein [Cryobacterium cryoconiti]TFD29660.1 hypothetical protein E3T49_09600 [Cryobacterium cryoconiti]